ncbi:hypothetical protein [Vibrio parahaemolyticus]|uniref:hypothetical protein n=1 Tax=Vibrio parahaemolyticus TaxID=670 RepID=UPI0025576D0F|nr:hypothetical protein [Vibrio parahaemolyticus]
MFTAQWFRLGGGVVHPLMRRYASKRLKESSKIMYEEIQAILIKFNEKVVSANSFQCSLDNTTTTQLKDLYKAKESTNEGDLSRLISVNNLIVSHMTSGEDFYVGATTHTIESKINSLWLQHNRQNQWILAEVYESFEIFLTELYAFLGHANVGVWKESELPKASGSLNLDVYTELIKSKRITPRKIMNQLSQVIPNLKQAELRNCFKNINIRFAISVIENFRHLIVHKHGEIENKEAFVQKVIKESGCAVPKDQEVFYLSFIDYYLGKGVYSNHIHLLKRTANIGLPIPAHYSRINDIFKILLSYAHYVVECILEKEA